MGTLTDRRELRSVDNRRIASYEPHTMDSGDGRATPAYRVIRTVRTRRGFGTIIHTLTTFVRNKKQANALIARWVRMKTESRASERKARG